MTFIPKKHLVFIISHRHTLTFSTIIRLMGFFWPIRLMVNLLLNTENFYTSICKRKMIVSGQSANMKQLWWGTSFARKVNITLTT